MILTVPVQFCKRLPAFLPSGLRSILVLIASGLSIKIGCLFRNTNLISLKNHQSKLFLKRRVYVVNIDVNYKYYSLGLVKAAVELCCRDMLLACLFICSRRQSKWRIPDPLFVLWCRALVLPYLYGTCR